MLGTRPPRREPPTCRSPPTAAERHPDPFCEVAVLVRTPSAERYVRGFAAAAVAMAALVLAANAGPVQPTGSAPADPRTAHTPGASVTEAEAQRP
ncbi:hypothetical protein [Streptomyces leeuwenhoekii]|uniref:hypothetical protein n=1 Tax=Streptomyces leeuwenhoekii TaxID=1437453 RepID=UPI003BF4630B